MKKLHSAVETVLELVKPPAPVIPTKPRASFRIPEAEIEALAKVMGGSCDPSATARHRLLRDANDILSELGTIAPVEASAIVAKLELAAASAAEAYALVMAARDRHGIPQITG